MTAREHSESLRPILEINETSVAFHKDDIISSSPIVICLHSDASPYRQSKPIELVVPAKVVNIVQKQIISTLKTTSGNRLAWEVLSDASTLDVCQANEVGKRTHRQSDKIRSARNNYVVNTYSKHGSQ